MLQQLIFSIFISATIAASISGPHELQSKEVKLPSEPFNPNATAAGDPNRGGRIWAGTLARDGQFPFVNRIYSNKYGPLCTGAFITTFWTITALHCIFDDQNQYVVTYVIYGTASLTSSNRRTVGVSSARYWTSDLGKIDMALLRHERSITLSSTVGLVQLPPLSMEDSYYNDYTATQAGFAAGNSLMYHQLYLDSFRDSCPSDDSYAICAYSKNGISVSEGGDSGSPYFITENNKPTLVAVHYGLQMLDSVHVATRVSYFIREISSITGLPLRA